MNTTIPFKNIRISILSGLAIIAMSLTMSVAKAGNSGHLVKGPSLYPYDTLLVYKFSENKKYRINLFQDADKQFLLISADYKQHVNCRFYMFDMDGKLVTEADFNNEEITIFEHIRKGNYFFEIFNNDERIENGKLSVK